MPLDQAHILTTIDDAARYLRFHRSSIYRFMNEDPSFPRPVRIGKSLRFVADELDAWVISRREN